MSKNDRGKPKKLNKNKQLVGQKSPTNNLMNP